MHRRIGEEASLLKNLRNRHFDLIAFAYDRLLVPTHADTLKELLRLPVRGRLLDAGGGTGRASFPLRPHVDGVVVADLSPSMLRKASEKKRIDCVQSRTEQLPFPDGTFARVMSVDALHHFADQEASIAELVRVLEPRGRILIEEPDLTLPIVKLVAVAEKLILMESHFRTPEAIGSALEAHGLSPVIKRSRRFRSWILAEKPA
jgi:SAM-dependent methyltransferase